MQAKRGHADFDMSEPEFLISVMDRHQDWCVIVCLVGGGQEIKTGEEGLSEWLQAVDTKYGNWDVYISDRLEEDADAPTLIVRGRLNTTLRSALHLGISMRSFRTEALSDFVGHVVEGRADEARTAHANIAGRYPIWLTRDLNKARQWLRKTARGTERYGLVA